MLNPRRRNETRGKIIIIKKDMFLMTGFHNICESQALNYKPTDREKVNVIVEHTLPMHYYCTNRIFKLL